MRGKLSVFFCCRALINLLKHFSGVCLFFFLDDLYRDLDLDLGVDLGVDVAVGLGELTSALGGVVATGVGLVSWVVVMVLVEVEDGEDFIFC